MVFGKENEKGVSDTDRLCIIITIFDGIPCNNRFICASFEKRNAKMNCLIFFFVYIYSSLNNTNLQSEWHLQVRVGYH